MDFEALPNVERKKKKKEIQDRKLLRRKVWLRNLFLLDYVNFGDSALEKKKAEKLVEKQWIVRKI